MVDRIFIGRDAAKTKNLKVGEVDPLPNIAPALLSSDEIVQYALKTGMIAPFEATRNDNDSRLKNASYEGRLGKYYYEFLQNGKIVKQLIADDGLIIPDNSILFVETDLEFRFPHYIAMRFNLSIRHVHRGLLLGTGPLVDPGFRGVLCIPIHNLTNKPYQIRKDDGLIWIEVTKIVPNRNRYGRRALQDMLATGPEQDAGYWDAEDFLIRAADVDRAGSDEDQQLVRVPIQSSIPHVIDNANRAADLATEKANEATQTAKEARKIANGARWADRFSLIAVILGLGTILAGGYSIYEVFHSQTSENTNSIKKLERKLISLQAENQALKKIYIRDFTEFDLPSEDSKSSNNETSD